MTLPITRARRPVATVFDLLGDNENDMTAALGWAMSQAPTLAVEVIRLLTGGWAPADGAIGQITIALQTHRPEHGITDIELAVGDDFFAVLEAKRGAVLPFVGQLEKYAETIGSQHAHRRVLATLTDVAPPMTSVSAIPREIRGTPVVHCTWRQLRDAARTARANEGHAGKRVIDNFLTYLGAILGMEKRYSNRVYVVSLGNDIPPGWGISWIDVVRKRGRYFYPVAKGWPEPPNYIAFRYGSRLQSIHYVVDHTTYTNHSTVFPEAPDKEEGLHYCLTLGPAIVPPHEVTYGPRITRANRCWCMIDTLLTAKTISDALTETERREREMRSA